jgi:hypothetical protein
MDILKNIGGITEAPVKPRPRLPDIVPIPMPVRDILIVTGSPRFTRDHLHTHRLSDYARDLLTPVLLSDVYNPLDDLFVETGTG